LKKTLKYLLYLLLLIGLIAFVIIDVLGNFYKVDNDVYRSGQLNEYNLAYYAEKYKIKTILNLRGTSSKPYYLDEIKISNEYNITHIDHKISNHKYLDFNQTSQLIELVREAKKPLLIHCAGGADRTSLVVALYQYAIKKESVDEAKEAFSLLYGHAPFIRPKVLAMDKSFENYVKKTTGKTVNEKIKAQ